MAVAIYHGAAGSYKTASAVWFQILPALRAGRVVVTNIEGMKTIKDIETALGERFPISARIIRILSNNENGLKLWQSFYCWCPLGALIVIDEAQDIYNKTVGFDAPKNKYKHISDFENLLPKGFIDFYNSIFNDFVCPDPYKDDTGFSTVDDNGLPVLPLNYNSALMTHRHYNWDIYYLTPDIGQIDSSVRGVCEKAFHHASKDNTFFTKRRPRIWEHDPKTTSRTPAKDAPIEYRRVPVAVHLMYSSTTTGAVTKSGLGKGLLKEWRFWLFAIVLTSCFFLFFTTLSAMGSDDENTVNAPVSTNENIVASVPAVSSSSVSVQSSNPQNISDNKIPYSQNNGIRSGIRGNKHYVEVANFLNDRLHGLQYDFNDLYVSSVTKIVKGGKTAYYSVFKSGEKYIDSDVLSTLGYSIAYVSDCLVLVSYSDVSKILECSKDKSFKPERPDEPQIQQPSLIPFSGLTEQLDEVEEV